MGDNMPLTGLDGDVSLSFYDATMDLETCNMSEALLNTDGNQWCISCRSLKQTIEKMRDEYEINYKMLKEKIISTNDLIKRYKLKCDECDVISKKLSDTEKRLDTTTSAHSSVLTRLTQAVDEQMPLKEVKDKLEKKVKFQEKLIVELQDQVCVVQPLQEQLNALKRESDMANKKLLADYAAMKQQHKQAVASQKKVEDKLSRARDNLKSVKVELSVAQKENKRLSKENEKLKTQLSMHEEVVAKPDCAALGKRLTSGGHSRSPAEGSIETDENLLEMIFRDVGLMGRSGMMDSGSLMSPIMSPLPSSPMFSLMSNEEDSSDEDLGNEVARLLESEEEASHISLTSMLPVNTAIDLSDSSSDSDQTTEVPFKCDNLSIQQPVAVFEASLVKFGTNKVAHPTMVDGGLRVQEDATGDAGIRCGDVVQDETDSCNKDDGIKMVGVLNEDLDEEITQDARVDMEKQTPSVDMEKQTPSVDMEKQTPSVDMEKQTPSVDMEKQTPSVDMEKQTPSVDMEKQTPSVDTVKETPSVDMEKQTPSVDMEKQTPSVDMEKQTPSVDMKKQTPSVDMEKQTPSVDTVKDTFSADMEKQTPSVDTVKETHSADMVKETHSAETVKETYSADTVKETYSADTVKETHSADTVKETHSADTVKETHSADTVKETHSADTVKETYSADTVKETLSADMLKETISADVVKDTLSADMVKETHSVDIMKRTPSTDSLKETHSVDIVKRIPSADSLKETHSVDIVKLKPSAESVKETHSVDIVKLTPSADSLKEIHSVDIVKRTPSADSVKETHSVDIVKLTPSADSLKETHSVDIVKLTPSVDSVKEMHSVDIVKRTPSADSVKETHLVDIVKRTHSADSVKETHSVDIVKRTPSADSVKETHSVDIVKRTPSADSVKETHSVDIVKRTHSADSVKETHLVDIVKRTPSADTKDQTHSVDAIERSDSAHTLERTHSAFSIPTHSKLKALKDVTIPELRKSSVPHPETPELALTTVTPPRTHAPPLVAPFVVTPMLSEVTLTAKPVSSEPTPAAKTVAAEVTFPVKSVLPQVTASAKPILPKVTHPMKSLLVELTPPKKLVQPDVTPPKELVQPDVTPPTTSELVMPVPSQVTPPAKLVTATRLAEPPQQMPPRKSRTTAQPEEEVARPRETEVAAPAVQLENTLKNDTMQSSLKMSTQQTKVSALGMKTKLVLLASKDSVKPKVSAKPLQRVSRKATAAVKSKSIVLANVAKTLKKRCRPPPLQLEAISCLTQGRGNALLDSLLGLPTPLSPLSLSPAHREKPVQRFFPNLDDSNIQGETGKETGVQPVDGCQTVQEKASSSVGKQQKKAGKRRRAEDCAGIPAKKGHLASDLVSRLGPTTSDHTVIDEELQLLLRGTVLPTTTATNISRAQPAITADILVDCVTNILYAGKSDLLPVVYYHCTTQLRQQWHPFMTADEHKILELLLQLNGQGQYINVFEVLHMKIIKILHSNENVAIPGRAALCRMFTAVCRIQGDISRVRVFAYNAVRCGFHAFPRMILSIAAVWPAALRTGRDEDRCVMRCLQYVIYKSLQEAKVTHSQMWQCLAKLCGWQRPGNLQEAATNLAKSAIDKLLLSTEEARLYDAEKCLELLSAKECWQWTNNQLIIKLIWPVLQQWATGGQHSYSDCAIESLLRILGVATYNCPLQYASAAYDILQTLHALLSQSVNATVPVCDSIQEAVIEALMLLAPFKPDISARACYTWVKQRHQEQQLRPRVKNRIRDFIEHYEMQFKYLTELASLL